MCRLMAQRLGGGLELPGSELNQTEMPIIPARRVRIEPEGVLDLLDAFADVSGIGRVAAEERPGIRIVGIELQRLRHLDRRHLRLSIEHQDIAIYGVRA